MRWSLLFQPEYKLLVNGDKQEVWSGSEKRKDLVVSSYLSFLFFSSSYHCPWISYHCLTFLPTFFSSFLRCFHGNSLDIKTRFHGSSLLYALLRHKRTVVKRTIVNTIEQRASSPSLHRISIRVPMRYTAFMCTDNPARVMPDPIYRGIYSDHLRWIIVFNLIVIAADLPRVHTI